LESSLIAMMLGRLKMTIAQAKAAFRDLGTEIFKDKWWTKKKWTKVIGAETRQYFFRGEDLEKSVQELLAKYEHAKDLALLEGDNPRCHVYVIIASVRPCSNLFQCRVCSSYPQRRCRPVEVVPNSGVGSTRP